MPPQISHNYIAKLAGSANGRYGSLRRWPGWAARDKPRPKMVGPASLCSGTDLVEVGKFASGRMMLNRVFCFVATHTLLRPANQFLKPLLQRFPVHQFQPRRQKRCYTRVILHLRGKVRGRRYNPLRSLGVGSKHTD